MSSNTRPKNIIGNRLAEARDMHQPSLTQDELSGKLALLGTQLDRAAIAKIETNRRRVFDYELVRLAEALNISVTWLLGTGE